MSLRSPAGPAQAQFRYLPKQQGYQVQLDATNLRLDQLQTPKARNLKLGGVLSLRAGAPGKLCAELAIGCGAAVDE